MICYSLFFVLLFHPKNEGWHRLKRFHPFFQLVTLAHVLNIKMKKIEQVMENHQLN